MGDTMANVLLFPTMAEIPGEWRKTISVQPGQMYPVPGSSSRFGCIGIGQNFRQIADKLDFLEGDHLVVLGYGGGLVPELYSGDVVVCTRVIYDEHPSQRNSSSDYFCNRHILDALPDAMEIGKILQHQVQRLILGPCYTSHHVVQTPKEKQTIVGIHPNDPPATGLFTGALVVDMETYFVAQFAKSKNLHWCAVRIILDTWQDYLPDLSKIVLPDGQISIPRTIGMLALRPYLLPSLLRLRKLTRQLESTWQKVCWFLADLQ